MKTIDTATIKTIAQATDKALFILDYSKMRLVTNYESYARINARSKGQRYVQEMAEISQEIEAVSIEIAKLDKVYQALGGWERYIIVPGGHIHNYGCSTLFQTTQTVEAYMHSAENVESLIEKAGDRACTVCFPDAPVNKPSTIEQYVKEREQREAEAKARNEKKAKAQSEAITDENGKVAFKTIRALTNEISWQMGSYVSNHAYVSNFGKIYGSHVDQVNPETKEEYFGRMIPKSTKYKLEIERLVKLAEDNGHDVSDYIAKAFTKKVKEQVKYAKDYPSDVEFPEGFTEKF